MKSMTMNKTSQIACKYNPTSQATVFRGNCLDFTRTLPKSSVQLIVTSPPYNIGKEYEKRLDIKSYLKQQTEIITECTRVLSNTGSICWQVGNYTNKGAIIPLDVVLYPIFIDLGLTLRNRIVWHFEHGLHCSRRLSGRYETIMWFTKSDNYFFNLDTIRVPQKYPGKKYFKGPKAGEYSCNPLGKNPGDVWAIPNVKSNHVEKTSHPCQFPVELVERLVLSMSKEDDLVLDPFLGSGTTIIAAIKHNRRGAGSEIKSEYISIAEDRIRKEFLGNLKTRPMNKPVYDPIQAGNNLIIRPW